MRLIDADALMEYTQNQILRSIDCNDIARFPLIDAVPVKHGRWEDGNGNHVPFLDEAEGVPGQSAYCSVCGKWLTASDEYWTTGKYCPNCGAKMDGDGNA